MTKKLNSMRSANKEKGLKTLLFLIFILAIPVVLAQSNYTLSDEAIEISDALELAEKNMNEMLAKNISVTRYNDTLTLAKEIYNAQLILEKTGSGADYSFVREKLSELGYIKEQAFRALDELNALKLAINQAEEINKTIVIEMYEQAKTEFKAERYEECLALIDKTYEKISELEAIETKFKAFYEATSRNIVTFLMKWWKELVILLSVIILTIVLTYNRIMCKIIQWKINNLKTRKLSIKKLIKETQREYFEKGKISETVYRIRTKKYAEFIRDINRQIPVLQEELAMRQKRKI